LTLSTPHRGQARKITQRNPWEGVGGRVEGGYQSKSRTETGGQVKPKLGEKEDACKNVLTT